jgi:hypothetical protein
MTFRIGRSGNIASPLQGMKGTKDGANTAGRDAKKGIWNRK